MTPLISPSPRCAELDRDLAISIAEDVIGRCIRIAKFGAGWSDEMIDGCMAATICQLERIKEGIRE